jgi:hypothetical protein
VHFCQTTAAAKGGQVTDGEALSRRLAEAVAGAGADDPLTSRVCHAVRDVLGADGVSVTVETSVADRVTVCATDRRAQLLENLQDVLGEGPCRDAFDSGSFTQTLLDGAAAVRWPYFTAAARKVTGAGILWSFPMRAAGQVIGTVSAYRLSPGRLAVPAPAVQEIADEAAALLLHDPLAFAEFTGPGPASGWSSRALVHQATGMLAAQLQITLSDALAIMRSYAFTAGTQLTDVAQQVTSRTVDLSER